MQQFSAWAIEHMKIMQRRSTFSVHTGNKYKRNYPHSVSILTTFAPSNLLPFAAWSSAFIHFLWHIIIFVAPPPPSHPTLGNCAYWSTHFPSGDPLIHMYQLRQLLHKQTVNTAKRTEEAWRTDRLCTSHFKGCLVVQADFPNSSS